ncbi:MAG: hypothetical protein V4677_01860 [Bacteroidota bacterium]
MTPFQNPTIYLGDLRIDEPITTVTDFLFIGVCFYAFAKTKQFSAYKGVNLYRWFFLLTGCSSLIAALIGHAFLYHFGFEAKIYGWVAGIISISFAQFAALHHTRQSISKSTFKTLQIINYLEIVTASILLFVIYSFTVVEIHTAYSLVINVTILECIHYKKTASLLSRNMIIGVGVCVLAVLCHVFKIAFSVWFNHLDLSHIFMAISMYMMYRGVASFNAEKEIIK